MGRRNSILMTCQYPNRAVLLHTYVWVVRRHQYGISALVSQTSFRGETSGGVAKCRIFSKAVQNPSHTVAS